MSTKHLDEARKDALEPFAPQGGVHPVRLLLEQVRAELAPQWICIDARAGFSEPAGLLLSGMAHLQVLFGTSSRALVEFRNHYYAPDPDDPDEDLLWYVRDAEASDAPSAPVAIPISPGSHTMRTWTTSRTTLPEPRSS